MRIGYITLVLAGLVVCSGAARAQEEARPLIHAHAHNDYRHERPLLDALDHGFCSFEADIHLVDGALLVAHEPHEVQAGQTLEKLYLAPLRARVRENESHVYKDGPNCILLIDIKTEAEATYRVLREELERYADVFSVFRDGAMETGAVTAIISGNAPRATMAAEPMRYCGFDGRPTDLEGDVDPVFMPLISDRWGKHFQYVGDGTLSDEERAKLRKMVKDVHARGAIIRFWATPERPYLWGELLDAGVDLINTDRLDQLRAFLLEREPGT